MPISKLAFVRSTVLAILVGLAALLLIVGFNLWLVSQARVYSDIVTLARQERSAIVDLRNTLDDAETGQRGYLLTGERAYLEPYLNAESHIPGQIEALRKLTNDDLGQSEVVEKLVATIAVKMAELRQTIDLFDGGRRDESLALVKANHGKEAMDQARQFFGTLLERAESNLTDAVREEQRSIEWLQWVTIGGALAILLVVGGSVWTVLLYTRQLIAAQREVAALNIGLEERVRERTADLGRANEEIQRFAYIVTHDLRAPLVNVMGFTSELEGSVDAIQSYVKQSDTTSEDEAVKKAREAALEDLPEAIGFIRSSTRKMDGLINAILKLSREGRRVLKPEPIELEALLKTAAANVQHQVTAAGGEVSIDGGHLPPVISDRLALEQIFGNLFDNAVKYRSPSRPLRIGVKAREERGHRVVVEIEDNGRGIAKPDHDRVFDLFRRSGSQDTPGEGIGLAHVRSMIRNLGGDITLQSEIDQGTTMRLNLPRDLRRVMAAQSLTAQTAAAPTAQTIGAA
jgi:signal transduction histidine kinase